MQRSFVRVLWRKKCGMDRDPARGDAVRVACFLKFFPASPNMQRWPVGTAAPVGLTEWEFQCWRERAVLCIQFCS